MENFDYDSPEYQMWAVKTNLTSELDLSGFNLSEIPEAVFDLPQLKTLIIANSLPYPDSFQGADLTSTKEDALNDPDLSEKQKRLIVALWRKHNAASEAKILVLPETIANLNNLEVLDLSGQALTSLPDSLTRLPRLRKLHLSRNQLQALPSDFDCLRTLEGLDVRGNADLASRRLGANDPLPEFRGTPGAGSRRKNAGGD